ncbi:MAG: alpha/beta hydrolase [Alphaproteobacteria bacterium]
MLSQAFLHTSYGHTLAYQAWKGDAATPGILFLGGYRSDMEGTKAKFLMQWAQEQNRSCVVFDYTGHGSSSGNFETCTLSDWLRDAAYVLEHLTQGPQVLIGSSMGGWLMLLLARRYPERFQGLIGIACAPDFTQELLEKNLTPAEREILEREGSVQMGSGPFSYPIFKHFLEDARKHLILNQPLTFQAPLHLLHGTEDERISHAYSQQLMEQIEAPLIALHLIQKGDHRLHEPPHLNLLRGLIQTL